MLSIGVKDWEAFKVIVPTTTFEDGFTIKGDGYHLELEHIGGKHAPDSITVKVIGEDIMFLGDSFYPPPLCLKPPDMSTDNAMLQNFSTQTMERLLMDMVNQYPTLS